MIDKMPFVKQEDSWGCSNAVASSILRYYRFPRKKCKEIISRMISTPIDGSDPRAVEGFYRSIGLSVIAGDMNWEMLQFFGKKKIPCVILVNYDGVGHYVISLGISSNKISIMDPISGFYKMNRDEFEPCWVDWDKRFQVSYTNFGIAVWKKFDF